MKPKAYMMVGVPGSGKSTWLTAFLSRAPARVISSDKYIEDKAAEEGSTYNQVFKMYISAATKWMQDQLNIAIELGEAIAWDQTNLSRKSRKSKLDLLTKAGYDVTAVVFELPEEELERRRNMRKDATGKTIPTSVLQSMQQQYQRPTRLEGFAKVILVTADGEVVV